MGSTKSGCNCTMERDTRRDVAADCLDTLRQFRGAARAGVTHDGHIRADL